MSGISENDLFSENEPEHRESLDDLQPLQPIVSRENLSDKSVKQPVLEDTQPEQQDEFNRKTRPIKRRVLGETVLHADTPRRDQPINASPAPVSPGIARPTARVVPAASQTVVNAFLQPQPHTQVLIRAEHGLLLLLLSLIFFVRASNPNFN